MNFFITLLSLFLICMSLVPVTAAEKQRKLRGSINKEQTVRTGNDLQRNLAFDLVGNDSSFSIYQCVYNLNDLDTLRLPAGTVGFNVRVANRFQKILEVYSFPNGFGQTELISGQVMTLEDLKNDISGYNFWNVIVIEEYVDGFLPNSLEVMDIMCPSQAPSLHPTPSPSAVPSSLPTASPSRVPSASPTPAPTGTPTTEPTDSPTVPPTISPSASPTADPPSPSPSVAPSLKLTGLVKQLHAGLLSESDTTTTTSAPSDSPAEETTVPSPTPSPITPGSGSSNGNPFPSPAPSLLPVDAPSQQPNDFFGSLFAAIGGQNYGGGNGGSFGNGASFGNSGFFGGGQSGGNESSPTSGGVGNGGIFSSLFSGEGIAGRFGGGWRR